MTDMISSELLPHPITVRTEDYELDELLKKEWLLTNRIGGYASSTVIGVNTRRYHGLLVGATAPPVGRIVALATVLEELDIVGTTYRLATNEFVDEIHPRGVEHLVEFRNDVVPTFVFRVGDTELTKELVLTETHNAVAIRYTLRGEGGRLRIRPFVALRDFHHLRRFDPQRHMTFEHVGGGAVVQDRSNPHDGLYLIANEAVLDTDPQWWYQFRYRVDVARGQDHIEDLYTPGWFVYELSEGHPCQFTASLRDPIPIGFQTTMETRSERLEGLVRSVGDESDETTRRLAIASDAFVVRRSFPNVTPSTTILAGYHWFADWSRDTFISLPGLLLCTGRFDAAREVFRTFAQHISDGMIPNRFDDYSNHAHYNSIDGSLWFIIAAQRYMEATNDASFWGDLLLPICDAILTAYQQGTRFSIHADSDDLLTGGSPTTQLTWMDAALGGEPVTPRHGKAVEINALWYCAHRIMSERCREVDAVKATRYAELTDTIGRRFVDLFWNDDADCLFDCITDNVPDPSIRPNQIFAVSLPYSALSEDQQQAVVRIVTDKLLTPMGLRSLSPDDPRYRSRYGGSLESRDRAYHQGTVWGWLMGPFIEAYLKVQRGQPHAIEQARKWLAGFDEHLSDAGLGYVSEIFDADPPHTPRGCIAQGWSVAEILRAKQLITEYEKNA